MGDYREVHFDSRSEYRTLGDSNKPTFIFNDPLYVKKYAVRALQLPLNFFNCYKTEDVFITRVYNSSNVLELTANTSIPAGLYYFNVGTGTPTVPTDYTAAGIMKKQLDATFTSPDIDFNIVASTAHVSQPNYLKLGIKSIYTGTTTYNKYQIGIYVDTVFAKLLGYHPSDATEIVNDNGKERPVFFFTITEFDGTTEIADSVTFEETIPDVSNDAAHFITKSTKFSDFNYVLLRSDMAHGAHFLPSGNAGPNFTMSNVLQRIPIQTGNFVRTSYMNVDYGVLDRDTMFSYNGHYLDKATFWFTYPESDTVIDFRDKNFVLCLGLITSQNL